MLSISPHLSTSQSLTHPRTHPLNLIVSLPIFLITHTHTQSMNSTAHSTVLAGNPFYTVSPSRRTTVELQYTLNTMECNHQTMTFIHSDREVDNHHTVRTHCTIQPCTLFISSKISPSPEISRLGTVSYIPLSEAGSIVLWYCHCVPIYRCKCMSRYCTHCSNSS